MQKSSNIKIRYNFATLREIILKFESWSEDWCECYFESNFTDVYFVLTRITPITIRLRYELQRYLK